METTLRFLEEIITLKKKQLSLINAENIVVCGPTIRPIGSFTSMDLNNISLPFWVSGEILTTGPTHLGEIDMGCLRETYFRVKERLVNQENQKDKLLFFTTHFGYRSRSSSSMEDYRKIPSRDVNLVCGRITDFILNEDLQALQYHGYLTNLDVARNVLGDVINGVSLDFDFFTKFIGSKKHIVGIDIKGITLTWEPALLKATMRPRMEETIKIKNK